MGSFTPFPNLPSEIRSMIWVIALREEEYQLSGGKLYVIDVTWKAYNFTAPRHIHTPRLVLACQEARQEWARIRRAEYYEFCEYVPDSLCNPRTDLVRIKSSLYTCTPLAGSLPIHAGFCSNGCQGSQVLSKLCLKLTNMTPRDITRSQRLDCQVRMSPEGWPLSKERDWSTTLPLKRMPVDELALPRLRDVWFEGKDLLGTHMFDGRLLHQADEALFDNAIPMGLDIPDDPTYTANYLSRYTVGYLFRYSVDTGKVEAAVLSREEALICAAGERWGDSIILESKLIRAFTLCRITIRRQEGKEADASDKIRWQEIRPEIEGESRAMLWHRIVWNALVEMFVAFLCEPHRAPHDPCLPWNPYNLNLNFNPYNLNLHDLL